MALEVIERVASDSGTLLLDVCHALWAMQALKEKKAVKALERLDADLKSQAEALEETLQARLVAVNAESVEALNDTQRQQFKANANQQRQHLLANSAWEFRQLLALQQLVLGKLNVPTFGGDGSIVVDAGALDLQARVCSYLHSAFYLRSRVGEAPHLNMLKGHMKSLQKEQSANRGNSPPPPYGASQQLPPPPTNFGYLPPQQQPPMMGNYPMVQQQLPPPPPPYGNQQYPPPPPPPYY